NTYDVILKAIRDTKKLTDKPFGAGIFLEFDQTHTVREIFEEKLACMQVFWGDYPKEMVDEAHKNGVQILHQVGSVADAEKTIAAGVDCIIAHVSWHALVPRIVDLIGDKNITVVAAGAIADPHGFVATKESYAHDYYQKQLLKYTGEDTDYTDLYSSESWRAPTRVLNTPFHQKWKLSPEYVENNVEQPIIGCSIIHGEETVLRRFAGQVENKTTAGEYENMVMYAGQGVGHVNDILPTGDIVKSFIEGVEKIIKELGRKYGTIDDEVAAMSLA
ncbi:hypothetical protein MKX03_024366, partial [Papaver bracteatum]